MQALHSTCINHALVVKLGGIIPWPVSCNTCNCEVQLPHIAELNFPPFAFPVRERC